MLDETRCTKRIVAACAPWGHGTYLRIRRGDMGQENAQPAEERSVRRETCMHTELLYFQGHQCTVISKVKPQDKCTAISEVKSHANCYNTPQLLVMKMLRGVELPLFGGSGICRSCHLSSRLVFLIRSGVCAVVDLLRVTLCPAVAYTRQLRRVANHHKICCRQSQETAVKRTIVLWPGLNRV